VRAISRKPRIGGLNQLVLTLALSRKRAGEGDECIEQGVVPGTRELTRIIVACGAAGSRRVACRLGEVCMYATTLAIVLQLAATAADPADAKQGEVLDAIRARLAALEKNDTAAWSRWVADDMITPLEGDTPSKAAWVKTHAAWPREVAYWYGPLLDPKVRIHGDTAVVVYHAQQFTKVGGQTTSVHKWQIETHERRGGRWQLVGVADATIPPEPVAVKLDAATLDAYVGDYEWSPTMVSKVRRSGDALSEEIAGQGTTSYFAENDTTFFVPGAAASGDATRVIFVKNAEGRVTHYIYRDFGATDRIVKKVR